MSRRDEASSSSRVLTVPNLLSFLRIALIPVFVVLIVDPDTTFWGLLLFAVLAATDWVDGLLARRLGQVTELGKVLDPTADRLAMAAGLVALAVRGVFPWWAAALILVRDAAVLAVGAALLVGRQVRLDVRRIGKVATFTLMAAIVSISWGNLGYPLEDAALALGWVSFAVGIVEYYVAAWLYIGDLRHALAEAA
ncbi:MAG TPA: CDP-alcohol phosphatidyltransferase family protein [Actinomycetota bacterium]|nr:CDP-alcohol phosphatidyltransferase family protein [Actinomycetota bacterium]